MRRGPPARSTPWLVCYHPTASGPDLASTEGPCFVVVANRLPTEEDLADVNRVVLAFPGVFEQFRRTLFPRERHITKRPDELVNDPFEALRRVARDPFESFEEALRRVPN